MAILFKILAGRLVCALPGSKALRQVFLHQGPNGIIICASLRENLSSGVFDKACFKPVSSAIETS